MMTAATGPSESTLTEVAEALAAAYCAAAAASLIASRLGWQLFGIGEPIVELTAVHFVFAGSAALVLAVAALGRARSKATRRLGIAAVVLTGGAPPLVALGFVSGWATAQVGGAVLLSLGVWSTSTLALRAVLDRDRRPSVRVVLAVEGLATWIPMVLAVAWAAGQHWDVPALSVPDMARTHGLVNALAFVACGLIARRIDGSAASTARGLQLDGPGEHRAATSRP
jgi:hypothetical protein